MSNAYLHASESSLSLAASIRFQPPDPVLGTAGPSRHCRGGEARLRAHPYHQLIVYLGETKEWGPQKLFTWGSLWQHSTAKANGRAQHPRSWYPSPDFLFMLTCRSVLLTCRVPIL